jgi:predicted amidohydrolase
MALKEFVLTTTTQASLAYKARGSAIRGALANRAYPRASQPTRDRVGAAAVQMHSELVDDGAQFALKCYALARQAVEGGAALIVFPEYAWLPLLGLLPAARALIENGFTLERVLQEPAMSESSAPRIFQTLAPAIKSILETTGRELASRFGAYIMIGTGIALNSAGQMFNTAYLFGADGALIGTQAKLHPTAREMSWMTPGEDLNIFTLPFAKLAMPVCMDYSFWETTRIAALRGVDILLGFSAEENANEFHLAMRGIASRVQESYAYGIQACGIANFAGLNFCGPSYIVASIGMRRDTTTFLARTRTPNVEEVITAELDLARLRDFRASQARDSNLELYRKYLPQAYESYRARVTQDGKRRVV